MGHHTWKPACEFAQCDVRIFYAESDPSSAFQVGYAALHNAGQTSKTLLPFPQNLSSVWYFECFTFDVGDMSCQVPEEFKKVRFENTTSYEQRMNNLTDWTKENSDGVGVLLPLSKLSCQMQQLLPVYPSQAWWRRTFLKNSGLPVGPGSLVLPSHHIFSAAARQMSGVPAFSFFSPHIHMLFPFFVCLEDIRMQYCWISSSPFFALASTRAYWATLWFE